MPFSVPKTKIGCGHDLSWKDLRRPEELLLSVSFLPFLCRQVEILLIPVGLAFCVMKTFLKAVMLAKTISVQLIILSCVGLTNAEVFCLLFSLTKLIF